MDTFGNGLRFLLSKTEKNSDISANSDNLSPVKPLNSDTDKARTLSDRGTI